MLADLALRAVVAQEEIAATDEEVDAEIERIARADGPEAGQGPQDLERRGVLEAVRSDIARGKALEFLVDHAEVVDEDGNTIDLSLPQPDGSIGGHGTRGTDTTEPEGSTSDGPVTGTDTDESETEEEPAS